MIAVRQAELRFPGCGHALTRWDRRAALAAAFVLIGLLRGGDH